MRRIILYRFLLLTLSLVFIIVSISFHSNNIELIETSPGGSIYPMSEGSLLLFEDTKLNSMPPETDLLIIPLKSTGRLFMIEANIDNMTGNLIFDTGATGLVMNLTYFRKYLKMEGQNSTGITGPVGEVNRINLGKMNVSGLSFANVPAAIADLGHIENRRGVKVLGLIGFEYFREFEIVIDAMNNELQLHRIDSRGERVNKKIDSFKPDIIQPIEVVKNILFVKGIMGGKVMKFCLDTGAETNAVSSHSPKAVINTISLNRKSNLSGAGQKSVEVLFGTMNDFVFGGHKLINMETIVTHLDNLNEAYGVLIDGMLGYNFLAQGTICVNFTKKQLGMRILKTELK